MDKKKRTSLIDRLDNKISKVIPDIQKKDTFKKIREKLNTPVNEKFDGYGDDIEEEILKWKNIKMEWWI